MRIKKQPGEVVFDTANVLFMVLLMAATMYPFVHVLMTSFSEASGLMGYNGFMLLPRGFSAEAYRKVLANPEILRSFVNSVFYVAAGTLLSIVLTLLGGYALSRKDLYWKPLITVFLVIPMYFGGGLIPTYLLINSLGMKNSIWAVIIPGCVGTYNIILARTNFQSIPAELEESAVIDGAPHLVVLFRILVPLSLPIIAVMTLWQAVGIWNSWFGPSIYLTTRRDLWPIQLILREIMISTKESATMMVGVTDISRQYLNETIKNAVAIVSIIPVIAVYPFLQKYFVKGVLVGAIKG